MTMPYHDSDVVRVFIGSSPKNRVEERVFIHSLLKSTTGPLDVQVIDAGQSVIRSFANGSTAPFPLAAHGKVHHHTTFSLARFMIPYLCGYTGRALYCDSDQVALADIGELWRCDLEGHAIAAVPSSNVVGSARRYPDDSYLTSVMVLDCSRLRRIEIGGILQDLERGDYSYSELMYLKKVARSRFDLSIKALPNEWNHLDIWQEDSKLVHFTTVATQPWRSHNNPFGPLWDALYWEAIESGLLSPEDISTAFALRGIRRRTRTLPAIPRVARPAVNAAWRKGALFLESLRSNTTG